MQQVQFDIQGMSCGGCVASVRRALATVPGVNVAEVAIGSAVVETDGTQTSVEMVKQALDDAGFTAEVRSP